MKAFVTGATGLLGNNLVRALVAQAGDRSAGPAPRIPYPIAWTYASLAQTWARITGGQSS